MFAHYNINELHLIPSLIIRCLRPVDVTSNGRAYVVTFALFFWTVGFAWEHNPDEGGPV